MNWGIYIKKLREEAHLTQKELSEKSGLGRSHISNIERGHYKTYKPEYIERIASGIGRTTKQVIDYIYEGDKQTVREEKAKYSYDDELEELLDDIKYSVRRIEKKLKEYK